MTSAPSAKSRRARGSPTSPTPWITTLRPDNSVLEGPLPGGLTARALVKSGEQYAIYLRTGQLPGQFSARWTGTLTAPRDGEYTLITESNDGVRLWLDNRCVIDNWTEHSITEDRTVVQLRSGQPYPLKVEFFYAGGQMAMKLLWEGPGISRQPIPRSALLTPQGESGLRAEYFYGQPEANGQVIIRGYSGELMAGPDIEIAAQTDETGQLQFEFQLPPHFGQNAIERPVQFDLEFEVADSAGETEGIRLLIPVAAQPILINAIPESGLLKPGIENVIYVLTSYPDGQPAETTIRAEVDGKEYTLAVNNDANHLHGGLKGFDKVLWKGTPTADGVELTYTSKDGEEGYPGNLSLTVLCCSLR